MLEFGTIRKILTCAYTNQFYLYTLFNKLIYIDIAHIRTSKLQQWNDQRMNHFESIRGLFFTQENSVINFVWQKLTFILWTILCISFICFRNLHSVAFVLGEWDSPSYFSRIFLIPLFSSSFPALLGKASRFLQYSLGALRVLRLFR